MRVLSPHASCAEKAQSGIIISRRDMSRWSATSRDKQRPRKNIRSRPLPQFEHNVRPQRDSCIVRCPRNLKIAGCGDQPMPDHVHVLISIPPKYSVAEVIGYLKGKSSIWLAQNVERKLRNFLGHKFWARSYFVSSVGQDEERSAPTSKIRRSRTSSLDQLQLKLASS